MSSAKTRADVGGHVGYVLKEAQHALRARLDEALRPLGSTAPQYAALAVLAEEPGISGARLARRCFVTPQTMNGITANLESAGLIARRPDPGHGRILQTSLSATGAAFLKRVRTIGDGIESVMLEGFTRREREHLRSLLERCTTNLRGA